MLDLLLTYQSNLRRGFFLGSIYMLLCTILLTITRIYLVGDWQSVVKVAAYLVGLLVLWRALRALRHSKTTVLAQRVGVVTMLLMAALYVAITPHVLFVIGVLMLATILFFAELSTDVTLRCHWLAATLVLYLVALTLRQWTVALRLDLSADLLLTLYLFPPVFFWIVSTIGANLKTHLYELLVVGQELEADLRQRELQYQQLLQTMNEGFVVVDNDDRFLFVNDKFCELVGYTQAELIGQRNADILRYDEENLRALQAQTALRLNRQQSTYELTTQRKDGAPIWIHVSARPQLDDAGTVQGAICVVMDITQRKQVEAQLRAEHTLLSERVEERTASLRAATEALQKELAERKQIETALRKTEKESRTLFDNVPIGIYRTSLDGRQLRANPALVALNGYATEEEMLADVRDIANEWYVDKTRRADFATEMQAHGLVRNFESEIYRYKTRERIWVSETALLVRSPDDQPLYYQGTVQDITERKQHEASQARIIEQLAKVARLKDEFLASMSHELRTPLNSILGMTEALQDEIYGPVSERQLKALTTVESSGRHLLALINDILDLAKIESGQVELVVDAVDVMAVCEASLHLLQPAAKKKAITVAYTHDPAIKVMMADGRRLKQILINLLSNAIKFTPNAGNVGLDVSVVCASTASAPTGDPALYDPAPLIHFSVWDTGVGIADAARPYLFQPFVQLDSSLARSYEGTGLGLALVQRMAELHGGGVTVDSRVGEGSRFTVTLPWHLPNGDMPPLSAATVATLG